MQESCKAKIGHTFNGQTGIVTDFFANRDLFKLIYMYNLRDSFDTSDLHFFVFRVFITEWIFEVMPMYRHDSADVL